jgi:hypothetical protein
MDLNEWMPEHGEDFRLEREDELYVVEGIKTRSTKEIKFRPGTDVRAGDWLRDASGRRFYVYDTDVQRGFERQPFALVASYQTEQEHEASQAQQPAPATNINFHVQNAYNSIFGTQQNAEMNNVTFDSGTVEAELDRAEEEIERRGGRDEAELKELIAKVREAHERGEPLDRGRFAKYLGVIQRNGWIAGPVAGTLLSTVIGA